jgi:hypothetical protein
MMAFETILREKHRSEGLSNKTIRAATELKIGIMLNFSKPTLETRRVIN